MYCKKCWTQLPEGARTCPGCNASVTAPSSVMEKLPCPSGYRDVAGSKAGEEPGTASTAQGKNQGGVPTGFPGQSYSQNQNSAMNGALDDSGKKKAKKKTNNKKETRGGCLPVIVIAVLAVAVVGGYALFAPADSRNPESSGQSKLMDMVNELKSSVQSVFSPPDYSELGMNPEIAELYDEIIGEPTGTGSLFGMTLDQYSESATGEAITTDGGGGEAAGLDCQAVKEHLKGMAAERYGENCTVSLDEGRCLYTVTVWEEKAAEEATKALDGDKKKAKDWAKRCKAELALNDEMVEYARSAGDASASVAFVLANESNTENALFSAINGRETYNCVK